MMNREETYLWGNREVQEVIGHGSSLHLTHSTMNILGYIDIEI